MKRGPQQGKTDNAHTKHMAEALDQRPVTIVWRRKPNGILIAVHVDDPHGDPVGTGAATANYRAWQRRQRRPYAQKRSSVAPVSCEQGHEFDSWNTIVSEDGTFTCRICTAHTENAPLLASARRVI